MELHVLHRGNAPLIVDVPHAGTHLPADIASRLTPDGRALADTDWHVDKLYDFVRALGVTLMSATHARYVVDLNRDPAGIALYQGADNTEMCPTRTFARAAIYRDAMPDAAEIAARRALYFDPYHSLLHEQVERVRTLHGYAILLDGHSIRSQVPRFFSGRLPDLNLGTVNGASCAFEVESAVRSVIASAAGFTSVVNGRFKGGYVTRHYGAPQRGVHALQLEMAQACYMDEAAPYRYDEERAAALIETLKSLVSALIEIPHRSLRCP